MEDLDLRAAIFMTDRWFSYWEHSSQKRGTVSGVLQLSHSAVAEHSSSRTEPKYYRVIFSETKARGRVTY